MASGKGIENDALYGFLTRFRIEQRPLKSPYA